MRVRSADGQVFDAWVNLPENHRRVPEWLGQVDNSYTDRTDIIAPDGSRLTVGLGAIVANQDGRLAAFAPHHAARLFDIIEGGEEFPSPQRVVVAAQPEGLGRARQGMVTSDRGRLQPDYDPPSVGAAGPGDSPTAEAAGDSGPARAEQDGEHSGEPAAASPTEATATGGPGGETTPAVGAVGSGGESGDEDNGGSAEEEAGGDGEKTVTSRRRRK